MKKLKNLHISNPLRLLSKTGRRPLFGLAGVVLVASILAFSNSGPTNQDIFTQDDWSGGQGTGSNQFLDADRVITSNAGEAKVDNTEADATDWCNVSSPSDYCNANWKKRKSVTLNNPAGTQTDYPVRIVVNFEPNMADNFNDIRFTNQAGDTGFSYYKSHWVSRDKAYFWIKAPSLPSGNTEIYMYYGNPSATSLSGPDGIVYWTDNFHSGSTLDPTYWYADGESIINGELYGINHPHIKEPNSGLWNTTVKDLTFQFDIRMDPCSPGVTPEGLQSNWPSYGYSAIKAVDINCGANQFNMSISTTGLSGDFITQPHFFNMDETATIRVVSLAAGGVDYYYSTDNGISFTKFENYTRNSETSISGDALFSGAGASNGIPSNMTVIPTGPDIAFSMGDEQGSNWCNTANCDESWPMREEYNIKNSGDAKTDFPVKVRFTAWYGIKDFSDLRFTDESGARDLSYWVERATGDPDHLDASIWVKIPSLPSGITKIYVYHDKSGVSSLSNPDTTITKSDKFSTGSLDYSFWADQGHPEAITVDGSQASATIQGNNEQNGFHFDLNNGRQDSIALNYDIKIDASNMNCGAGQDCEGGYVAVGDNSTIIFRYHRSSDDNDNYWYVSGIEDQNSNDNYHKWFNTSDTPLKFSNNEYVTFKMRALASGGNEYYFSRNQGETFTRITGLSPNTNNNQHTYFGTANWSENEVVTFKNVFAHKTSNDVKTSVVGSVEWQGGYRGVLTSRIIDLGEKPFLGNVNFGVEGNAYTGVKIRTSSNPDMSGAEDFAMCNTLPDGADINTSSCVSRGQRYLQYQIIMPSRPSEDLLVNSVTIEYFNDTLAPNVPTTIDIYSKRNGNTVANGGWVAGRNPYLNWGDVADNGQSGVLGYCLYLGTDNTADPVTSSGNLTDSDNPDYNGLDTSGTCRAAVSNSELDVQSPVNVFNNETYYLIIKTIDNAGNISEDSTQVSFKIDTESPAAFTVVTVPSAVGSKIFHVSWITGPLVQYGDQESGFAGVKYCVSPIYSGGQGCGDDDPNWYGSNHTSGRLTDTSDVIPFDDGGFDTVPADADRLDNMFGLANFVFVKAIDNAGNSSFMAQGVVVITQIAPPGPEDLEVTPDSNTQNAFSFSWDVPAFSVGSRSQLEYCWTVNVLIATDGSNCNWTGKNIYSLAQGAYATQQGTNTLYMITKDVTDNFDASQYSSVDFSATTTSPGPPRDLDSSDASTRSTSSWKIALSWSPPTLAGSGVNSYKIFRSTNNVNFTEVGTTTNTNTSFVDTQLDQVDYYYYVKACDNANSCSVKSDTVTRKPTGRFTTPPRLTADTDQPKINNVGTKKATVFWFTDRDSDSKVAFGLSSGKYFPEEIGNSDQTGNHVVKLTNLQPNTKYFYVTKWTDSDGNTGVSSEKTFTTLPPPVISEAVAKNITIDSANITLRSRNASKIYLYYGRNGSLGGRKSINTATRESSYSIPLFELNDGTKYDFKLNGVDADGNEFAGNTYSFTTPARPKITNLRFQPVTGAPSSTQKVTWTTNVPSNSSLSYGPKGSKRIESLNAKLVTDHSVIISDLQDDTSYTLVASSVDESGNKAVSDTQTFTTALDTRAPKISNILIENTIRGTGAEARGQVIVSWNTDEPASSQVSFGKGQSGTLTSSSAGDTRLTNSHVVVISDLPTSSIYRLQPVSNDKAGNTSEGDVQTTVVGRGRDNVFGIVLGALQKIFGI